jgi:hypothetical protein
MAHSASELPLRNEPANTEQQRQRPTTTATAFGNTLGMLLREELAPLLVASRRCFKESVAFLFVRARRGVASRHAEEPSAIICVIRGIRASLLSRERLALTLFPTN